MWVKWLLFSLTLLWTGCDSVRYGSTPCEEDNCEISQEDLNGKLSSSSREGNYSYSQDNGLSKSSSSSSIGNTVKPPVTRPDCKSSNEGESFFDEKENTVYYCISETWQKNVEQVLNVRCKDGNLRVEELAADSGSLSDDELDFRRTLVPVTGVAQKGPFRLGASVKLVELDSILRLADSKRSHEVCVFSSDGSFDFGKINLVSPYARAEVNGFYRDEITGEYSSSLVTLKAVVDLSKRDSFNVNMLTHLAAPRVMKLVEDSGNNQPIGSMNGRALNDVLSSFGITLGGRSLGGLDDGLDWNRWNTMTTTNLKAAEDLNLFGSDDYSAALLAVTVMMQSMGSAEDMLSFANTVAEDIRGDGNWADNTLKAKLADKLLTLDVTGSLERIRKNLEAWNLGEVPNFEKHVRNFWVNTHGFETCGTMNAGQVKHVGNSQSEYFVSYYEQPEGPRIRFICDGATKTWREATDIEKDTVGFEDGTYDGQFRNGKINLNKIYVYEQSKRSWREVMPEEIMDFTDAEEVLKNLQAGEKVIFIMRHAERTDDTGKNGHLTSNGKSQSQSLGKKFKGENIYFANSTYTRSFETCENVAIGAGISKMSSETIPELDGNWFVKDNSKFESYKNSNGGGWVVTSEYAYKGSYLDAYYLLKTRGAEFMTEIVKPRFAKVNKIAVWISHDMFMVPLAVYGSEGKVNLRYFDTKQWINYLAGVAIIMDASGNLRYVPVKGLDSGTMTM